MDFNAATEPLAARMRPQTLDAFADALRAIRDEALDDPEILHAAPHTAPLRRLDEVQAARQPILRWQDA